MSQACICVREDGGMVPVLMAREWKRSWPVVSQIL